MSHDPKQTVADFKDVVNMTATQLKKWLATDESKEVGQKADGKGESVGHHMGGVIVDLLGKKAADYTDDDYAHMAKVVGYVHRHLKQRPGGEIEGTPWKASLMNWGHDPSKPDHKAKTRKSE